MTAVRSWIAAAAIVAVASISFAQNAPTPQPDRGARETGRRLTQVMKYNIIIQDDQPAGQVVDFVLSDGGCIDYIVEYSIYGAVVAAVYKPVGVPA